MQLIYINERFIHLSRRQTVIFNILRSKMAEECGVGVVVNKGPFASDEAQMLMGFLVLTDGTDLLCSAYLHGGKIIARYTPPPHRKKGYATELLRKTEEMFRPYDDFALWVVSYQRTINSNVRAGWVPMGQATKGVCIEPEFDYCPPSKVKQYKRAERSGGVMPEGYWKKWVLFCGRQIPTWGPLDSIKLRLK